MDTGKVLGAMIDSDIKIVGCRDTDEGIILELQSMRRRKDRYFISRKETIEILKLLEKEKD